MENSTMHPHRHYHLALALLVLCAIAALVLAAVVALGMQLTPGAALAALAISGLLVAGITYVHAALREARWNAGQRLR
jgi:archaellum biogenesis protein FlaJ (TadC family)